MTTIISDVKCLKIISESIKKSISPIKCSFLFWNSVYITVYICLLENQILDYNKNKVNFVHYMIVYLFILPANNCSVYEMLTSQSAVLKIFSFWYLCYEFTVLNLWKNSFKLLYHLWIIIVFLKNPHHISKEVNEAAS